MKLFTVAVFCAGLALSGASLGPFEANVDVGITPAKGKVEFDGARGYQVTGGGANVWGSADAFHYAWKKVSGDVALAAEVKFVGTGAVAHRKAMLMVRQSLDPDSPYADAALHGDGLTSLQYREAAGAPTLEIKQEAKSDLTAPVQIRIERRGDRFTMTAGRPGEATTSTGPVTIALKDPVYVGIAVCSHDANILETAVFANVNLQNPPPQRPPVQRYRSKITIFDIREKSSKMLYTADTVFEAPNWFPDGKNLLVNSGGKLYRLPVDGANPTPELVAIDPTLRLNNDHAPSPDGKKLIAFSASSPTSRGSQVYVSNSDGTNVRLMVSEVPSYFHGWSPDGKYLAYVHQHPGPSGTPANYDVSAPNHERR
jgi:hypothetical protein